MRCGLATMFLAAVAMSAATGGLHSGEGAREAAAVALDRCLWTPSPELCLRKHLLSYLDDVVGPTPRSSDSPSAVFAALRRLLKTHSFTFQLPEYFENANLVFRPGRGLDFDVQFPQTQGRSQARDMMKQKMLFPLLMLIKLKLKALTPILLVAVGIKAMKALILSKIAVLLVVGFLIVQLCQKLGMGKMSMAPATPAGMDPTPMPPMSMYGPPTTSSYDPSAGWEPAGGPYSRVYESPSSSSSAQQLAYNSYAPQPAKH